MHYVHYVARQRYICVRLIVVSNTFTTSVSTPQKTQSVSITKTSRLMLCSVVVSIYCDNHMKHINMLYGEGGDFIIVKRCDACRYK
jgi:hypothetical protein